MHNVHFLQKALATSFVSANERAFAMRVTRAHPSLAWNFSTMNIYIYVYIGRTRSFRALSFSLQGFQPGKDSRTAKVGRHDVGGTFAQLRLGEQFSELSGSYSGRHLQTPLLDEQGGTGRHGQPGSPLSKDPEAVRGGGPSMLEETSQEQVVVNAERGRGHRCTRGPGQWRDERSRAWTIGAQQSVTKQWRTNGRKFLDQVDTYDRYARHLGDHRHSRVQVNTGWSSCAPIEREPIDFVYLGRPFYLLVDQAEDRGGGFICKYVCTGVYPLTRHVD